MQNTSNTATADKAQMKTGPEKISEKVAEKRRALGRGLESLLPGPRVVKTASEQAQSERTDSATEAPQHGSPSSPYSSRSSSGTAAAPSFSPSPFSTPPAGDSSVQTQPSGVAPDGLAETSVIPSASVDLHAAAEPGTHGEEVTQLALDLIQDNPYQTRHTFDEKALMELAQSIRVQGVLQPIVVRPGQDGHFKLILGERRLRASRLAEMAEIPAIIKRVSDQQAAEMTIVENLQRQDLNCVDQAEAFATLSTKFKLTQEQIGARVGMSRETVSNYMRLVTLGDGIIEALLKGTLTFSHARALLRVQDTSLRWTLAKKVIEEKMSVARLEDLVQGMVLPRESKRSAPEGGARWVDPNVRAAQRSLEEVLGMRVRIRDQHGRGKIVIEYGTIDDFDRVVMMLKGK
ncbi:MAG: ParB/RepB/Spo0J family partition protein [Terriglobales bacterium]|jgi:ParB family chromosome partitioning protein